MGKTRLLSEWKELSTGELEGIWVEQINNTLDHFVVMILAPDGPYEGGFFLFDIQLPIDYPFNPPKAKLLNTHDSVRIHPNLYGNGLICLSILGTFSGPKWAPSLGIRTVLLSIRSLLAMDHPIQGEPGHESSEGGDYTEYARQACLDQFIYKSLFGEMNKTFPESFRKMALDHFIKNKASYINMLKRNMEANPSGKHIASGRPYNVSVQPDYTKIEDVFLKY